MASVLLLYNFGETRVTTVIRENVEAFIQYSRHKFFLLDTVHEGIDGVDLFRFDAVVIHWTVVISAAFRDSYFGAGGFQRLVDYSGPKFVLVQDEYRWVGATIRAIHELGASVLFSALCEDDRAHVYDDPLMRGVELVSVFHGYLHPGLPLRRVVPFAERAIDVGYRARDLSGAHAWLGELAQEKGAIAAKFSRDMEGRGFELDVSTRWEDRLFGDDWLKFVASCRAVLGSETGSSICDRDDTIRLKVTGYVAERPSASFEEIRDACFPGLDWKHPVRGISPRMFEAAALKTLMINYEGRYQEILQPGVHYVCLNKDHSNLDEVTAVLADPVRAQKFIDRAYADVGSNPAFQYPAFVEIIDRKVDEYTAGRPPVRHGYSSGTFDVIRASAASERKLMAALDKHRLQPSETLAAALHALNVSVGNTRGALLVVKERALKAVKENKRLAGEFKAHRRILERRLRSQLRLGILLIILLIIIIVLLLRG